MYTNWASGWQKHTIIITEKIMRASSSTFSRVLSKLQNFTVSFYEVQIFHSYFWDQKRNQSLPVPLAM